MGLRGEETTRLFQESQAAAVDRIEAIVRELGIDCDFRRVNAFVFPAVDMEADDAKKEQDEECDAAGKAGVTVERITGVPLKGFENAPVLRYPNQATFHPLRYLAVLAKAIEEKGGRIFAHTIVTGAEETGDEGSRRVRVETKDGGAVEAAHAVFATNAPINDRVAIHSKMAPYRTYAVAFALPPGALPDALWKTDPRRISPRIRSDIGIRRSANRARMKFSGRTALVRSIIDPQLFRLTASCFTRFPHPKGCRRLGRQVPEV